MAGREQVLLQVVHAFIAAGARCLEVPWDHQYSSASGSFPIGKCELGVNFPILNEHLTPNT